MSDEPTNISSIRDLTAEIVAAYLRRNQVTADQMTSLISSVYQTLSTLGNPITEAATSQSPAVSIRQSVRHDYVVCLDCGWRGLMLRRHLASHGLTVPEYKARWKLSGDHPMTAPGYSERRSTMAKQLGLGRGRAPRREADEAPAVVRSTEVGSSQPRRRGRPRRSATPT